MAGRPDSNPCRQIYGFQNHVAMSRCTNWPPKLSTIMVIVQCTLNLQSCIIPFCVRSNTLIKMVYHSFWHDKCTMNYDHICSLMWKMQDCSITRADQCWNGQIVSKVATKNNFLELKSPMQCLMKRISNLVPLQSSNRKGPQIWCMTCLLRSDLLLISN